MAVASGERTWRMRVVYSSCTGTHRAGVCSLLLEGRRPGRPLKGYGWQDNQLTLSCSHKMIASHTVNSTRLKDGGRDHTEVSMPADMPEED